MVLTQISHESMCPVFLKQTVERQGSLVFCGKQRCGSQPTQWARGGGSMDFVRGGGDASPRNMSAAEHERVEPLERKECVCWECQTQMLILMENPG